MMRGLRQDLRFALRGLRRNPTFTAVTVAVMALGTGANTAIFSVVDAVVLRPLPFPDPGALVVVGPGPRGRPDAAGASWLDFVAWRERSRSLTGLAAYHSDSFVLGGGGAPEQLEGIAVTANLFEVLGMAPAMGRPFAPGEDQPGKNHVVVLSHRLWRQRFGGDPAIIGRPLILDGVSHTVIGVAAANLRFPVGEEGGVWVPMPHGMLDGQLRGTPGAHFLDVVGRLGPMVSPEAAQADLDRVQGQLAREHPEEEAGRSLTLRRLGAVVTAGVRRPLLLLLAAVGFVLLIACANVANLMLARATGRRHELAIRAVLGAGRGRIIRLVLTESAIIGLLGGAAGLALASLGLDALTTVIPEDVPRLNPIAIDGRVLGFALATALATGVLSGLAPALLASRAAVRQALAEDARTTARGRVRFALLVTEIALAFVLLVDPLVALRQD